MNIVHYYLLSDMVVHGQEAMAGFAVFGLGRAMARAIAADGFPLLAIVFQEHAIMLSLQAV